MARYIRGLIVDGKLRHGDHIRQDVIADELGVSRIPVREAIIALDREGWLTIEPHRGAFVHGIDENSVRDHYALLGRLFGLVAQRAVERATDEQVAALVVAAAAAGGAVEPEAVKRSTQHYLRHLFLMAGSPRLTSFSRLMTGVVPGDLFDRGPGGSARRVENVQQVTDAIQARDGERAATSFEQALVSQGEWVIVMLRERHLFRDADE